MITLNEGGIVIDLGNMLVVGPDWEAIRTLNAAHAAALADIHQIGFDSKHSQGWEYASFDAIANVLRPVLAKHELSIAPTMDTVEVSERGQSRSGNTELMATAHISLALMHSNGAMRITKHQGQGSDYSDKAINKAWTVAAKYALMRLFLISTGEKDEDDGEEPKGKQAVQQKPAQPKPTATVVPPAANGKPATAEPPKVQVVTNGKPTRPYQPETLKAGIAQRIEKAGLLKADEMQRGAMIGSLEALFANDSKEIRAGKRHMLTKFLIGKDSTKDATGAEIAVLLAWASERLDSGEYAPDPTAIQEAALVIKGMDAEAGQTALL